MNQYYQGVFEKGTPRVVIQQEQITRPLPHLKHHSDSFAWGYSGSGPADLARSLLSHHMGVTPPKKVYQAFKGGVIAHFDQHAGWVLQAEEVTTWCEEYFTHNGHRYSVNLKANGLDWEAEAYCGNELLLTDMEGILTPAYSVAYAILHTFTQRRAIPLTTLEIFAYENLFGLLGAEEDTANTSAITLALSDVEVYRWFRSHAHEVTTHHIITPATREL